MKISPFFKILRLPNLLLLALSVVLGFWLSHNPAGIACLSLLVIAAMSCAGFGNVVNDISDIETDRISHPSRPLARGEISVGQARIFSVVLAVVSLACSFYVSVLNGIGVLVPLVLLLLYAAFLKGTPLLGNVLVSLLVAYGIVFGGLTAQDGLTRLFIPALLAFLLNFVREIVKDVQDASGDSAANIRTSASLPEKVLKAVITGSAIVYVLLVFVPFILHQFGMLYAVLCLVAVVPLHVYWFALFYKSDWNKNASAISLLIKYEMLCGLLALALDQLFVLHV
jgi:geranylgeranylglycerol-phosphate geranylgeranyltransferase